MLEVKRHGAAGATALQRRELKDWFEAGAVSAVVRSLDDVKLLVGFLLSDGVSARGIARGAVDFGGSWEMRPVFQDGGV